MNKNAIIQAKNITRRFVDGARTIDVLKSISLEVNAGDQIALMGASGSGKSTLLQVLAGLDKPTSGEVYLSGQALSQKSEAELSLLRNKHLGFIYQFHHLLPEFTAIENVAMPLWLAGEKWGLAKEKASCLLTECGLSARATHKPGELSGGERQRAAIARALITKPKCILADEPTGNLDANTAAQVLELMLSLVQEHGSSLVVVTHDLQLAKKLQKIYELKAGALV